MITATDIGTLIQNPNAVLNYSSKDLEDIRNKYPYCATLHLLYLKSISLTNDLQFEDHLRFSAAHIIDREQMYYLIHSGENDPVKSEVLKEKTDAVAVETFEKFEAAVLETQNVIVEPLLLVESTKPVIEEISSHIDPEIKTTSSVTEKTDPKESSTTKELLDSAPDLVDMAYEADLADESAIELAKIESQHELVDVAKPDTIDAKSDVKEIADPIKTETPVDLASLSFVEWLKYKQTKTLPVEIDRIPEKIAIKTEEPISSKVDTKAEEIKKAKKSGLSRFDADALLNKF